MQNTMKIHKHPARKNWASLIQRPERNLPEVEQEVANILGQVRTQGDSALRELTLRFSGANLDSLLVTQAELDAAESALPEALREAIQTAKKGIDKFHTAQQEPAKVIETHNGVRCWRKSTAIERVGLYIPSDDSPAISAVLMLGVPAKIAGCTEIVLCTSPDAKGQVHPAVLYAAKLVGVNKIIKVGGAQAVAAMAYGTDSVPKVYKVFGSGNPYVMAAKHLVNKEGVAIDMPVGPPEMMLIADETANPAFVAADLLAQAEQSPQTHLVLVTFDKAFAQEVQEAMTAQLAKLPRRAVAEAALAQAVCLVLKTRQDAQDLVELYAPEHLVINIKNPSEFAQQVQTAGTVCLGNYTSSAMSHFATGTNHALPSYGFARAYGGLSIEDFAKKITYQQILPQGLQFLAPTLQALAEAENLEGSRQAVQIRLEHLAQHEPDMVSKAGI